MYDYEYELLGVGGQRQNHLANPRSGAKSIHSEGVIRYCTVRNIRRMLASRMARGPSALAQKLHASARGCTSDERGKARAQQRMTAPRRRLHHLRVTLAPIYRRRHLADESCSIADAASVTPIKHEVIRVEVCHAMMSRRLCFRAMQGASSSTCSDYLRTE